MKAPNWTISQTPYALVFVKNNNSNAVLFIKNATLWRKYYAFYLRAICFGIREMERNPVWSHVKIECYVAGNPRTRNAAPSWYIGISIRSGTVAAQREKMQPRWSASRERIRVSPPRKNKAQRNVIREKHFQDYNRSTVIMYRRRKL